MFEYASNKTVAELGMWPRQETLEQTERDIASALERYAKRDWIYWGIEHKADRKFIGSIGFAIWRERDRNAEVGYALNPAYWNQGLAKEACGAVIDFGWQQMDLHRLEAKCLVENAPSIAVLKRYGFVLEGVRRDACLVAGDFRDVGMFGLLRPERLDR
jgi:ribosomal-protein-alanine N-acetyltransferase